MKTIVKFWCLSLVMFMACSDPCDDVDCGNGVCDDGTCICDAGYEGLNCETEIRAKYLGTYSGDISSCFEGLGLGSGIIPAQFTMIQATVAADPSNINNVTINTPSPLLNIDDLVIDPEAGIFIIPLTSQSIDVPNLGAVSVNASGNGQFIDENSFELTLSIIVGIPLIPPVNCTITMTKN